MSERNRVVLLTDDQGYMEVLEAPANLELVVINWDDIAANPNISERDMQELYQLLREDLDRGLERLARLMGR